MDCQCNENASATKIIKCCICNEDGTIPLNNWDRYRLCELHNYKSRSLCGTIRDYVCISCKEKGWFSTKGSGGPTHYYNTKTMEEKLTDGTIIKKESISL